MANEIQSAADQEIGNVPFEEIADGFRGAYAKIIAAVQSGAPDEIKTALVNHNAGDVVNAFLSGSTDDIVRVLFAHDRTSEQAAGLTDAEAQKIAGLLSHLDVGAVVQALEEREKVIWTNIFSRVLPGVAHYVRSRLWLVQAVSDENSVANSVARTVLRRSKEGKFEDFELMTPDDLAAMFITIAKRKCSRRQRRKRLVTTGLDGGQDAAETTPFDTPGTETPIPQKLIRKEMHDQLIETVEEFKKELKCSHRVILQCKLSGEKISDEEIAKRVRKQCAGEQNKFRTVSVKKTWYRLVRKLRALCPDDADEI